jgi:hypothetical protein
MSDEANEKLITDLRARVAELEAHLAAGQGKDSERLDYIERKAVRGGSYRDITSIDIIVHGDDLALGGARYAIDCMIEREAATAGKGEGR